MPEEPDSQTLGYPPLLLLSKVASHRPFVAVFHQDEDIAIHLKGVYEGHHVGASAGLQNGYFAVREFPQLGKMKQLAAGNNLAYFNLSITCDEPLALFVID